MRLTPTRKSLFAPTLLGLASLATAQGTDTCANAQAIAGLGSFAFDNSAATTGGTMDPLCYAFGSSVIDSDVWFSWTAPADGIFTLDTCGTTAVDTKVSVQGALCNSALLDCNDDTCGLQSEVTWVGLSGQTYLLRVGTFPGATGGTGTFNVGDGGPVQDPSSGHSYLVVDQVGISWDQAKLDAAAMNYQGLAGHLVTIGDASENSFIESLGGTGNHFIGGFQNTSSPSFSEPAGGWEWITGEPMVYTDWNQAVPEPNNTGASGAEDYMEIILNVAGVPFSWNDVSQTEHPAGYIVEFETGSGAGYCFGDGSATACPCGNPGGPGEGCANSSGAGATLASTGSGSVAADDLGLTAGNLLPGQPGLLFSGTNAVNGGAGLLFGDGLRCAGGTIIRLGVRVPDGGGAASWGPGLAAQGGWIAGDTRRFQVWYRDPQGSPCGAGFNLTHGLELVFAP